MTLTIATVYRDHELDGVPASEPHEPIKAEIREVLGAMEAAVNSFLGNGGLVYLTRAHAMADLLHANPAMAWVISDPTIAYNGIYQKSGSSGSGTWNRIADLPFSFVKATDVGAGTPNAIVATSLYPVSDGCLVAFIIFDTNTGSPVTISFNGATPITIKTASGNNIPANGLVAGTAIIGFRSGSTFRLLTDQASAAIIAAAEAAQAAAEAAQAAAAASVVAAAAEAAAAGLFADAAQAAAEASGAIHFYDTKAAANTALAGLTNLDIIEVLVDESRGNARTRYRKESGVYVYKVTLSETDPIRYLSFLPDSIRVAVVAGTDTTTDQSPFWTAFRDALAAVATAGGRPHGVLDQCTIYTSTSPNFAIKGLTLETRGLPRIIATGTNPGFLMDATAAPGGFGIFGCSVGSLMAGTTLGSKGIDIRYIQQSKFDCVYSLGGTGHGAYLHFVVSSDFDKLVCSKSPNSGVFLATPAISIEITGDGSNASGWSTFKQLVAEHSGIGLRLDRAQGCAFLGGVSESNTDGGIQITANAFYNNFYGMDIEDNTNYGIECAGIHNKFDGIKTLDLVHFTSTASTNRLKDGVYNNITFDSGSTNNVSEDILFAVSVGGALIDGSGADTTNRFRNCYNHQTERYYLPPWKTYVPIVSSQGGATVATAAMKYFGDDSRISWTATVTVSVSGGGTGWLNVSMPFQIGTLAWSGGGFEAVHGKGIAGYIPANDSTLRLFYSDGTFPGDIAGNIITISGTCQRAGY